MGKIFALILAASVVWVGCVWLDALDFTSILIGIGLCTAWFMGIAMDAADRKDRHE